jgi:hypothetical protein
MAFSQTKDQSGVAVLQVEGQLIVGNRQGWWKDRTSPNR